MIILLIISVEKNYAQTYPFSNYTVESGLSQAQILSVFQDDEGTMWFGTSGGGITKYDGNSYEYITDKDGLADNVVYCIVKDKKGRILIGTNNGLSVYDPNVPIKAKEKKIKNYTIEDGLGHNRIFTIFFDHKGRTLLGTGSGISVFQDTKCSTLKLNEPLNSAPVFSLMEDSKHQLWCSTLGFGFFRYDGKIIKNYSTKEGLGNDMVFSVLEFEKDKYWFFTGEGLFELNGKKVSMINPAGLPSNATYYSYLIDKNNILWLASSNGVIKYNRNGRCNVLAKKNNLVDNSIWKVFQDRESNLWFASDQNGVSKLNSERFFMYTTKDELLHDGINAICESKDGGLLIGSKFGLSVYKDHKVKNYAGKELAGNSNILSIEEDKNGNYLLGTGNGLQIFNGISFKGITCNDKKSQMNVIWDVFVDTKGEVWLGTQVGVAKMKTNKIVSFGHADLPQTIVSKIYEDANGIYWFGTDEGLYSYDGKHVKKFNEQDGFSGKRVRDIVNDSKGNLWITTSNGIFKYNNKKFIAITEKQGLSSKDIYSIAIDHQGSVWVGLSDGLNKIKEKNNKFSIRHYGTDDGFIGQECNRNALLINKLGRVLIGTPKGLVVYQSEFDKDNTLEPTIKLKSIDLFFQKTDWTSYSDSVDKNIPCNLELPYDKNYLTFNFIGISLTKPKKVRYQYMLKGIDKGWRSSSKTDVTYSNIPSGNYELLIKANNGDGVWNKKPYVFKFEILPPFWKTWWFYSIIVLIILIGIYSYLKIRASNKKILKQNEIIEEKNEALQYANKEIAEKNQSITDSINYAKRIQQSFLTSEKAMNQMLKDYFILYKPRDIVSGDFYLALDLPDRKLIVCADCTGHGIPGAFMSLIGISLLNEISRSNEILDPAKILDELRRVIVSALNPDLMDSGGKDGMDIALISIFKSEGSDIKIHFSGANSSMYLVSVQNNTVKKQEFKGDKQPVGYYSYMKPFTQQEIIAQKGDTVYLFTDGYVDQFGGPKEKKFMSKQLKQKLSSMHDLPLKEQEIYLDKTFKEWQGDLEQVDDVTVIGIKL